MSGTRNRAPRGPTTRRVTGPGEERSPTGDPRPRRRGMAHPAAPVELPAHDGAVGPPAGEADDPRPVERAHENGRLLHEPALDALVLVAARDEVAEGREVPRRALPFIPLKDRKSVV